MLQPTEDLESLVGQKLKMKFLEVDEEQERVVFSARRAHSEAFTSGFKVQFAPAALLTHLNLFSAQCLQHPAPQRLQLPVWHLLLASAVACVAWPADACVAWPAGLKCSIYTLQQFDKEMCVVLLLVCASTSVSASTPVHAG